jgi:polysaccharide chain length determinant protein (PEP-CTERM system associated)
MFDEAEKQSSRSFDQLWAMVSRGRWWILLPLFLCWITVWSASWLLPTTYESQAVILIEQQKVPEQYVLSNVNVNPEERLQSMTQQILSRTGLQSIIDDFHLYPPPHGLSKLFQSEDQVEQMSKDIKIDLVQAPGQAPGRTGELTAFKINYTAESPELAQQVNRKLAAQFIDNSMTSQARLSQSTTSFLNKQLEDAGKKLKDQENLVSAFKAQHLGNLPSQLQSNVEILSGLQAQLQNNQHLLDGANQQKLYLDSQLQQLQQAQGGLGGDVGPSQIESLEKQLLDLRKSLADERAQHTENYPDIAALKGKVAETEKLIKELKRGASSEQKQDAAVAGSGAGQGDTTTPTLSSPLMQLRSQLKATELAIDDYLLQKKNIELRISKYEAQLNLTPKTEQELEEISRGYEESKANYNSLLLKQNQSQLATDLELRQGGEQFTLLDPSSLPDKPKSPNHLLLSLGGLALGCILGIGLLALRELTNARVRHEDDIDGIVQARILVRIPHLQTSREARIRTASRLLEAVAVITMALLIVAGNLYAFYKG